MTPHPGNDAPASTTPVDILICFAVKEEAAFFKPPKGCAIEIAGMGQANAERSIRDALKRLHPARVITAGFAGGLNPDLPCGTLVFEEDANFHPTLLKTGARHAQFCCHQRVIVTAKDKLELRRLTGADAVEMESAIIRAHCREHRIPSATLRVISDPASQDLPLDFNALMTPDYRIDTGKLLLAVTLHPGRIPSLIRFQKQTRKAARRLGTALQLALAIHQ